MITAELQLTLRWPSTAVSLLSFAAPYSKAKKVFAMLRLYSLEFELGKQDLRQKTTVEQSVKLKRAPVLCQLKIYYAPGVFGAPGGFGAPGAAGGAGGFRVPGARGGGVNEAFALNSSRYMLKSALQCGQDEGNSTPVDFITPPHSGQFCSCLTVSTVPGLKHMISLRTSKVFYDK